MLAVELASPSARRIAPSPLPLPPAKPDDVLVDLDHEDEENDNVAVVLAASAPQAPTGKKTKVRALVSKHAQKLSQHVTKASRSLHQRVISLQVRACLFFIGCLCAGGSYMLELNQMSLSLNGDKAIAWIGGFYGFSAILAQTAWIILCLLVVVPLLPASVNEYVNKKREKLSLV
jgi:hypothetical protein